MNETRLTSGLDGQRSFLGADIAREPAITERQNPVGLIIDDGNNLKFFKRRVFSMICETG
jgi:hypothetical protein